VCAWPRTQDQGGKKGETDSPLARETESACGIEKQYGGVVGFILHAHRDVGPSSVLESGKFPGESLSQALNSGETVLVAIVIGHQPDKGPSGEPGGQSLQRSPREEGDRGGLSAPLGPVTKATEVGGHSCSQGRQGCQENASLLRGLN
jgi:hypothetical protein